MVESTFAFDEVIITKGTISWLTINAGIVIVLTITLIGITDEDSLSTNNNEKTARRRLSVTSSTQLVAVPASRPSRQGHNLRSPARRCAYQTRGVFALCKGDSSVRDYVRSSTPENGDDHEVCRQGNGLFWY